MRYIGEMWVGRRAACWLKDDVAFTLFADEKGPSAVQLDLLEAVLSQNVGS